MKLRLICSTAVLAMASAAPAFAQVYYAPDPAPAVIVETSPAYPAGSIYVPAVRANGSPIHGGYVAPGDEQLLGDAMAALASDRDLNNIDITMVAKNGELIVNGVAKDTSQAARIERIVKRVANGHVTAMFTTQLG